MSKVNSSVCIAALALAVSGCATTDSNTNSAAIDAAVEQARLDTLPATPEEIAAAGRTDPLTRANFWSKEYEKNPANLETAVSFVNALREIGSHDRVIDVASRTATLHPDSDALMLAIGRSYLSQGQNAAATAALSHATSINSANPDAYSALGLSLDRQERHLDAQAAYRRALELDPTRTSTRSNFALSLALSSDLSGAEAELRRAVSERSDDTRLRENLAMVLGLQGRFDEMRAMNLNNAPAASMRANEALLRTMVGDGAASASAEPVQYVAPRPKEDATAETPKAAPTETIGSTPLDAALDKAPAEPALPALRKVSGLRGSLSQ